MDQIEKSLIEGQIVTIGDTAIDSNDIFMLCDKICKFHPKECVEHILRCIPCMPLKIGIYSTLLSLITNKNERLRGEVIKKLHHLISTSIEKDLLSCLYWCRCILSLACCYFFDFKYCLNLFNGIYDLCKKLYEEEIFIKADTILYIVLSNFFYISKQVYDEYKDELDKFVENCFELIDKRQALIDNVQNNAPDREEVAYAYTLLRKVYANEKYHDRLYKLKHALQNYLKNDLKSCATHRFYQKAIFQEALIIQSNEKKTNSMEKEVEESKEEKELKKLVEDCVTADHFANIKCNKINILQIDLKKKHENSKNSHDVWIIQEHILHTVQIYKEDLKLCVKILTVYLQLQSDFYNEVLIECIINEILYSFRMKDYFLYICLIQKLIQQNSDLVEVVIRQIKEILKTLGNLDNHSYHAFLELCCCILIFFMSQNKKNKQKEIFFNRKRRNSEHLNFYQMKRRNLGKDFCLIDNKRLKIFRGNDDAGENCEEMKGKKRAILRTYEEGMRDLHIKKVYSPMTSKENHQEVIKEKLQEKKTEDEEKHGHSEADMLVGKTKSDEKVEENKEKEEDGNKENRRNEDKEEKENGDKEENIEEKEKEKEKEREKEKEKENIEEKGDENIKEKEDENKVNEQYFGKDSDEENDNDEEDFDFKSFRKEVENLDVVENLKEFLLVVYNVKKKYRLKWIKNFFFKCSSLLHKEGLSTYVPKTIINYVKKFEIISDESHFSFWEFTVFKCLLKYSCEETMNMDLKILDKKTEREIEELKVFFREKMNLLISALLNFLNGKNRLNKVPLFFNNIRAQLSVISPHQLNKIDSNFYNRHISNRDFVRTNFVWNLYNAMILFFKAIILIDTTNASTMEILFQNHAVLFRDFKRSKFQNDVEREKFEMELINIVYSYYGRNYLLPLIVKMMLKTKVVYAESVILFFFTKMDSSDLDNFYALDMLYNVFDGMILHKEILEDQLEELQNKELIDWNNDKSRKEDLAEEISQVKKQISNFSVDTLYLFSENIMRFRRNDNSYMSNEMLKELLAFARRYAEFVNVDQFIELCATEKVDDDLKELLIIFKYSLLNQKKRNGD